MYEMYESEVINYINKYADIRFSENCFIATNRKIKVKTHKKIYKKVSYLAGRILGIFMYFCVVFLGMFIFM